MADTPTLNELVLRWHELRGRGRVVSPQELCADRPDLLADVMQQIEALLSMEQFLGACSADAALAGPTIAEPASAAGGRARGRHLPDVAGYEVLEELGRGAMGVVYVELLPLVEAVRDDQAAALAGRPSPGPGPTAAGRVRGSLGRGGRGRPAPAGSGRC
jgi:hypothetical protein